MALSRMAGGTRIASSVALLPTLPDEQAAPALTDSEATRRVLMGQPMLREVFSRTPFDPAVLHAFAVREEMFKKIYHQVRD